MPQQPQSVAERALIVDLWTSPLAPKIEPDPIQKSWRNDRDPTRRRATFEVPYPLREVIIEKSDDLSTKLTARFEKTKRRSIPDVRLYLRSHDLIFSDADFHQCKFHRPDERGDSNISGSTFKNCTFDHCILGGTVFQHVAFEGCRFSRCDFGSSQFNECQFPDCQFIECTAENASFSATEIDPTAFLGGMPPPLYNYVGVIPEGEESRDQIAEQWIGVRRRIAAQLLKSNMEIQNTGYSDQGLFELKRAELSARTKDLRTFRAPQLLAGWAVLLATKGGTSLSRLFVGAMIFVPVYTLLLSNSHVTFMNQDCYLHSFQASLVLQQIARATSLFLAIGYTAFSGGPFATVLLTLGALLGLFWYALIAAVVIHRVYR